MLHVDAINNMGHTLGFYFMYHSNFFRKSLWDRYWALGPDVVLFWKQLLPFKNVYWDEVDNSNRLRKTSALWTDPCLGLLPEYILPDWMHEEVRKRVRDSVKFAWIAAVVVA